QMITASDINNADISRRTPRFTVYNDKQPLQHLSPDSTLQHTDHEVEKHYNLYVNMLENGEKHAINQQELKKWSAEDEYATFVKTVHIALMHDWLKGKIIVDSLGLHSNNQRHTNETEQILTSSDLILYVSYFNHSFTDNDKAFI
uniref:dynamin family protein n=1 Tax=Staphylococcus hominis TaxID=1290 RepID=UPI000AEBC24C